MPKLRQNAEKYAREEFQAEIRRMQGEHNLMSVRALSREVGIPASTLGPKLKDPDKLEVADLRRIVTSITPDPAAILGLLGYDSKMIRKFMQKQEVAG